MRTKQAAGKGKHRECPPGVKGSAALAGATVPLQMTSQCYR